MIRHALAPCLLLLSAVGYAQTAPCEALNDSNTTVSMNLTQFGFGGPNGNGWQLTPTSTGVLFGGRFFTENTLLTGDRFMSIEMWSDVGGAPGVQLGAGTWKVSGALGAAWQGANFDTPVIVTAGQPVWVMWIDPGFSVMPTEPSGVTVPSATRNGSTWSLTGTFDAPKVRLFCSLLDDAQASVFGQPCAGSAGGFGSLFTNQQPNVGNAEFAYEGSGFRPGQPVLLVLGFQSSWVSIPVPGLALGCLQHTDVVATVLGLSGTGNQQGPTASGHVSFPFPIPNDPGLLGLFLGAQLAGADPTLASPLPFSVSNGLQITVF